MNNIKVQLKLAIIQFNILFVLGSSSMSVCIGSGISPSNVKLFRNADAFIVGTYFKKDGKWQNGLDKDRIKNLLDAVISLKSDI